MRRPCANCPWRKDAPPSYWDPEHFFEIWRNCQDDGDHVMSCHKSKPENRIACQGWVRVLGFEAIGVRIAVLMRQVTTDEINDRGGPELYKSFEEMMLAQGLPLPPRNRYRYR